MLKFTRPDGTSISKYEDWTPPKKAYHWKDGRSAKELAKAWFRQGHLSPPIELMDLLHSEKRFQDLLLVCGIPEHVTPLPVKGEGRNHDLWLYGKSSCEPVTICIEAKADEPFGNYSVAKYRQSAINKKNNGNPTGVLERIDALLEMVSTQNAKYAWDEVKYQLLTAICGTALQANNDQSKVAVLVIHEFHTQSTKTEKLKANEDAFKHFLYVLGYPLKSGGGLHLYGPCKVGGVDCFVGKTIV